MMMMRVLVGVTVGLWSLKQNPASETVTTCPALNGPPRLAPAITREPNGIYFSVSRPVLWVVVDHPRMTGITAYLVPVAGIVILIGSEKTRYPAPPPDPAQVKL